MPVFGDYETVGEPVAITEERGHVTTVWQAHKRGASDDQLFAVKCFTPRTPSLNRGLPGEPLGQDRGLDFLERIKQLKKSGQDTEGFLPPVHAFGLVVEGAWYATDFYPRSLKTWVTLRGRVDNAALRQVAGNVVNGCLALKRVRGYSHGNLKTSNVFLVGKPRALRTTPILLADPFPAANLQSPREEANDRATVDDFFCEATELHDLRAIGELILQLVEGRLVRSSYDYNYPIARTSAWDNLGSDGERWRAICNQLLDPHLLLEKVSLESLEKQFRPSPIAKGLPFIWGALGLTMLLFAGYLFVWPKFVDAQFSRAMNMGREEFKYYRFETAVRDADKALAWKPGNNDAGNLKSDSQTLLREFNTMITEAQTDFDQKSFTNAVAKAEQALKIIPTDPRANSLMTRAQRQISLAEKQRTFNAETNSAWSEFNQKNYPEATGHAVLAMKSGVNDDEAQRILSEIGKAQNPIRWVDPQFEEYSEKAYSAYRSNNWNDAAIFAAKALKSKPNDEAMTKIQNDATNEISLQHDYIADITNAKTSLASTNYAAATFYANLALKIIPGDTNAPQIIRFAQNGQKQLNFDAEIQLAYIAKSNTNWPDVKIHAQKADDIFRERKVSGDLISEANTAMAGYKNCMLAARDYLNNKKIDDAIEQIQNALRLMPGDSAAQKLLTEANNANQVQSSETHISHPILTNQLGVSGFDFVWIASLRDGAGAYVEKTVLSQSQFDTLGKAYELKSSKKPIPDATPDEPINLAYQDATNLLFNLNNRPVDKTQPTGNFQLPSQSDFLIFSDVAASLTNSNPQFSDLKDLLEHRGANVNGSSARSVKVGTANEFSLFNVLGNSWEWCNDGSAAGFAYDSTTDSGSLFKAYKFAKGLYTGVRLELVPKQ